MNKIPRKHINTILEAIASSSLDISSPWNLYKQIIKILRDLRDEGPD